MTPVQAPPISPADRNARLAERLAAARRTATDPEVSERTARRARQQADELIAELWKANLPLVLRYAAKFDTGDSESLEAYREAGQMALAEAIMTWDPAKGKLSTWAWPRIKKAVLHEVGRKEHRLKAHAFAARPLVLKTLEELRHELAHARKNGEAISAEPSHEQVAARAELPVSLVHHVLANEAIGRTISLNAPTGDDGSELGSLVAVPEVEDYQDILRFADIPKDQLQVLSKDTHIFELVCGLRRLGVGHPGDFYQIGSLLEVSREAARKGFERFSTKVQESAARNSIRAD